MNHALTTAHGAGARDLRVQTTHIGFAPILRRDLLRAIRTARRRLGLSTGDVLVLDTLLSFLPCRDKVTKEDRPINEQTMLVIYASNAAICERANGMDERVLRRHIARLVAAGLLARRDSATCKRFPLRARGQLVGAYGIDLTPFLCRHVEITRMAQEFIAETQEARALRAEALTLRAEILRAASHTSEEIHDWVFLSKTVLRRATLGLADIRVILERLSEIASQALAPREVSAANETQPEIEQDVRAPFPSQEPLPLPEDRSAKNGRIVRQVESTKIDTIQPRPAQTSDLTEIWSRCHALAEFYPQPPRSASELKATVYEMGLYLGLKERPLAEAIATVGWSRILKTVDYLVENAARIQNPSRYLGKMVRDFTTGKTIAGLA